MLVAQSAWQIKLASVIDMPWHSSIQHAICRCFAQRNVLLIAAKHKEGPACENVWRSS